MGSLEEELVALLSSDESPREETTREVLGENIKDIKQLRRHQVTLDESSYQEFWQRGDRVMESLASLA